MLDDTLRRTLEERLRDNKDINKKLFRATGPLGNLGPKIDLSYQLFAFSNEARNTLYGISEIRNFFAHHLDASFDAKDKPLVDAFKKLTLHEGRQHYPDPFTQNDSEHEIESINTKRGTFLVNLQLGLIYLMSDRLSHVPNSNLPKDYFSRAAQHWLLCFCDRGLGVPNPNVVMGLKVATVPPQPLPILPTLTLHTAGYRCVLLAHSLPNMHREIKSAHNTFLERAFDLKKSVARGKKRE